MTSEANIPPSRWSVWLSACRPRTLPTSVAPVLVGTAVAARSHHFVAAAAALCLGFALLVQIGTNLANDYFDFLKGADTPGRVGPRRAVASGLVHPEVMRRAMLGVFAAAFTLGLGLLPWGGPWMLAVGVASIICGIAYTGGPYPLAYHGLGDVFVFLFFGLVAVGTTAFVQMGHLSALAVVAGVPMGLLSSNILLVNNYRDYETDLAARKRTLVVRLGRGFALGQFATCHALALAVPAALAAAGLGLPCLLPLLLAPLSVAHVRRLARERAPAEQIRLLGDTAKFIALYAILFGAGILAQPPSVE